MQANPQPKPQYSWSEVWTAVMTKPSVTTFVELLQDPQATPRRAYVWVYGVALVSMWVVSLVLVQLLQQDPELSASLDTNASLLTLWVMSPLLAGFVLLIFVGLVAAILWMANQLSGEPAKPRFNQLVYVMGAVFAPTQFLGLLFLVVPLLGLFSLFLAVYQVVLFVQATRAVFGLDASKATMAVLVPFGGMIFVFLLLL